MSSDRSLSPTINAILGWSQHAPIADFDLLRTKSNSRALANILTVDPLIDVFTQDLLVYAFAPDRVAWPYDSSDTAVTRQLVDMERLGKVYFPELTAALLLPLPFWVNDYLTRLQEHLILYGGRNVPRASSGNGDGDKNKKKRAHSSILPSPTTDEPQPPTKQTKLANSMNLINVGIPAGQLATDVPGVPVLHTGQSMKRASLVYQLGRYVIPAAIFNALGIPSKYPFIHDPSFKELTLKGKRYKQTFTYMLRVLKDVPSSSTLTQDVLHKLDQHLTRTEKQNHAVLVNGATSQIAVLQGSALSPHGLQRFAAGLKDRVILPITTQSQDINEEVWFVLYMWKLDLFPLHQWLTVNAERLTTEQLTNTFSYKLLGLIRTMSSTGILHNNLTLDSILIQPRPGQTPDAPPDIQRFFFIHWTSSRSFSDGPDTLNAANILSLTPKNDGLLMRLWDRVLLDKDIEEVRSTWYPEPGRMSDAFQALQQTLVLSLSSHAAWLKLALQTLSPAEFIRTFPPAEFYTTPNAAAVHMAWKPMSTTNELQLPHEAMAMIQARNNAVAVASSSVAQPPPLAEADEPLPVSEQQTASNVMTPDEMWDDIMTIANEYSPALVLPASNEAEVQQQPLTQVISGVDFFDDLL